MERERRHRGRSEERPHRRPGGHKTHRSALVVIPPEEVWEPVQAIRHEHDRKFRRWMPHINLLYPYRPQSEFDFVSLDLVRACEGIAPFELTLSEFRFFDHGEEHYTVWLAPEPAKAVADLHWAVWKTARDCDEVRDFKGGFVGHLSVGQVVGEDNLARLLAELHAGWQPLRFTVDRVSLIWRNEAPDDVFRVDRTIPLGG